MYSVFAYLAIFRLEELGFRRFREFTAGQDSAKMYNFVNYLFDKVRGKTLLYQVRHHLAKLFTVTPRFFNDRRATCGDAFEPIG